VFFSRSVKNISVISRDFSQVLVRNIMLWTDFFLSSVHRWYRLYSIPSYCCNHSL